MNKLVKEYYHQVWQILRTELKLKNITAINILAVPILVYSFGIVNWLRKELEKVYQQTRKLELLKDSTI
jgi:hypothetical protein